MQGWPLLAALRSEQQLQTVRRRRGYGGAQAYQIKSEPG